MKNPLSPGLYLRRNAGKTLPLIGVIVLAVTLICAIVSLINSIPLSVRTIYKYSSHMLGVTPRGDPSMTQTLKARFEKESPYELDRISRVRASETEVKSIVGKWTFAILALEQDDIKFVLNRLDSKKITGRLPLPGKPELIMTEPVVRNLGLKIGDVVLGPEKESAYSPYDVKLVGIAQTNEWAMISNIEYYELNHLPPIDLLLVFAKNESDQPKLDAWAIEHFKGERARMLSYSEVERESRLMFSTLYMILNVVIGTLVFVITIMMGMLINIYLSQRTQEFGLLQALGYTKASLVKRVALETILVVFGGWVLGLFVAMGLLNLVYWKLMYPSAYALDITDTSALIYTIPVPVAILLAAVLTLWHRFRTFDPVGVVERRLV